MVKKPVICFLLPALVLLITVPNFAQTDSHTAADAPHDPKAQKSYDEGLAWLKRHMQGTALDSFKKADKQDGGRCVACQAKIIELGESTGDFKSADAAAQEEIA